MKDGKLKVILNNQRCKAVVHVFTSGQLWGAFAGGASLQGEGFRAPASRGHQPEPPLL